jgi:hypothetical protein
MPSPIEPLMNAIAASPFRVAPEAAPALSQEVHVLKITLEFVNDPRKYAEYTPGTAVVRLGTQYLEVLWSAAHAFVVVFDEYEKANRRGDEYFQVGAVERTRAAYSLYRQLLQAHVQGQPLDWLDCPFRPVRFPEPDTDAHVANELFLTAISWVVHHEIAHARLSHGELTVSSVLQESDADRAATNWLCRGAPEPGPLFKRGMGVACALLHLLAYDLEHGRITFTSHPPTYERLALNLQRMGFEDSHKVYAFAFVLLEILLAHHGVEVETDRQSPFHEMLASACMRVRGLGGAA